MKAFKHIFTFVLAFILMSFGAMNAQSDDHSQLIDQLKSRDAQIKQLLSGHTGDKVEGELKTELIELINQTINFKEMGKLALGDELYEFTDEQKEEFYSLFASMIRENSIKNLDIYKADIRYEEVRTDSDNNLIVQTVSSLDNVSTPVYYTFVKHNSDWVIADFAIDNASTARSYQRSFSRILAKRGVEGLLKVLRKKVNSAEQS